MQQARFERATSRVSDGRSDQLSYCCACGMTCMPRCARRELNPHDPKVTAPSTLRVCRSATGAWLCPGQRPGVRGGGENRTLTGRSPHGFEPCASASSATPPRLLLHVRSAGFEPATVGLEGRCSSVELRARDRTRARSVRERQDSNLRGLAPAGLQPAPFAAQARSRDVTSVSLRDRSRAVPAAGVNGRV